MVEVQRACDDEAVVIGANRIAVVEWQSRTGMETGLEGCEVAGAEL